jgi:hypothetical protein
MLFGTVLDTILRTQSLFTVVFAIFSLLQILFGLSVIEKIIVRLFQKPLSSIYAYVHELKVIIYHVSDFEFAEEHASLCPPSTHLFLQPEWSKESKLLPQIIEYTKQNPQWRISLQTHKYMNIP